MTAQTREVAVIEREPVPTITPLSLIEIAVKQGADVERMKQLFELQIAWEKNEAHKAYVAAMTAFKEHAPKIIKDKAVKFGNTNYKHALAGVASEQIGAALAEHGLSHRWDVEQADGGIIKVTCILTHEQGHSERVTLQATPDTSGSKNSIQAIGSTVSYLQRYSLFAATGLVPKDADDDGAGGSGGHEMPEKVKADFNAAIDAVTDDESAQKLWAKIAAATTQYGDVPAHDSLRAAMAAKRRTFKVAK